MISQKNIIIPVYFILDMFIDFYIKPSTADHRRSVTNSLTEPSFRFSPLKASFPEYLLEDCEYIFIFIVENGRLVR